MRAQRLSTVLTLVALLIGSTRVGCQEPSGPGEPACGGVSVISVTSRPTIANATDTTQCGTIELEYGLERQWPGAGTKRDDLSGGLRIGLAPKLDLHWSSSAFLHVMDGSVNRNGFGDTWLGLKYRLVGQTKHRPAFGVFFASKVPSASPALGGSGEVDYTWSFLASKDVSRLHFDFNVIELMAGRSFASGFDHNTGFALSSWLTLTRRVNLVAEPYGYTLLGPANPAFASTMMGFNCKIQPRLYLDSGVDVGVTSEAPKARVFVGITYAIGNFYSWMKPPG